MRNLAANLVEWLGPEVRRFWATSFTVDEHEAFALIYRCLGGRIPAAGVHISYHRRGLRRAGRGVLPRSWLRPVDVPNEAPVPTYHPKLLLTETREGYVLVVSTGNIATDDLRHTRNLAVRLRPRASDAKRIAEWMRRPRREHRHLCLLADRDGGCRILGSGANRSTLTQMVGVLERCERCRSTRTRAGRWIVAAPFWSPGTIDRLFELDPDGHVEAYFRFRTIWDQTASGLRDPSLARRVSSFELRDRGELPRWHHKVLGWRCCERASACAALYVGSSNATICGLVGRAGKGINWEAGTIWLGGGHLWEHARRVARAGYAAHRLGAPRLSGLPSTQDDELGPAESEELQRIFTVHAARAIRVNRSRRLVSRTSSAAKRFRALGHRWVLAAMELWLERKNQVRDLGRLSPGVSVSIPKDGRAHVRAVFRVVEEEMDSVGEGSTSAEATIDLTELDPEPVVPEVTTRSSIAAALLGLMGDSSWSGGGDTTGRDALPATGKTPSDVRFPFAELLALQEVRPTLARAWLERIVDQDEPLLKQLPQHWRDIARELQSRT